MERNSNGNRRRISWRAINDIVYNIMRCNAIPHGSTRRVAAEVTRNSLSIRRWCRSTDAELQTMAVLTTTQFLRHLLAAPRTVRRKSWLQLRYRSKWTVYILRRCFAPSSTSKQCRLTAIKWKKWCIWSQRRWLVIRFACGIIIVLRHNQITSTIKIYKAVKQLGSPFSRCQDGIRS